jgi:RNA polymerase sigma factor (sigma-70 family)
LATGIRALKASEARAERPADSFPATDGELLMQFTRHGDHQAFAQIVERHGGLVWIVCREQLGHHQDVEDAFQATFFILAERAKSIRSSDSAAAWLYKVAQRTSLAARRKRAMRREEVIEDEFPQGSQALPLRDQQMIYVLMEELRALPQRYQVPLVLRYLEGRSRREIAEQTDSTLAQIQGRLVRGKRLLRSRMVQRGVSLSIAAGALAGVSSAAKAAVTPSIAAATAKSCLALKTSGAVVGATATAIELAQQGAKAMWLATMMKTAVAVSGVLVASGIAWGIQAGVGVRSDTESPGRVRVAVAHSGGSDASSTVAIDGGNDSPGVSDEITGLMDDKVQSIDFEVRGVIGGPEDQRIEKALAEQSNSLLGEIERKAEASSELELAQLEKSLVQRELEKAHEAVILLELEAKAGRSDEELRQREDQLMQLKKRIDGAKDRLRDRSHIAARLAAELERMQNSVQRDQRQVEALESAHLALRMPQNVRMRSPTPESRERVVERRASESRDRNQGDAAQIPQLQMERDSWRMKAEAFRLKAQVAKQQAEAAKATGSATESAAGQAESMLMQADANHAEAMALEMAKQLDQVQAREMKLSGERAVMKERVPGEPAKREPAESTGYFRTESKTVTVPVEHAEQLQAMIEGLRAENAQLKEQVEKLRASADKINRAHEDGPKASGEDVSSKQ